MGGSGKIGTMDSAYFVGRNEILSWINSTLHLNISHVEEAASGAIHCQMMDVIHPGVVPMHKVNYDARTEYDMIQNYKILQEIFNRLRIDKHIEVNKLIKGRPLDNLEFLQWLKRYFDINNVGTLNGNYKAVERRCKSGKERSIVKGVNRASKPMQNNDDNNCGVHNDANSSGISANEQFLMEEIKSLSEKVADLKLLVDDTKKERNFYFYKLRDVEVICQRPELQHLPTIKAVRKILYAFSPVEERKISSENNEKTVDLMEKPCN